MSSYEAMLFAMEAHKEQKRKYTGDPYWVHLAEVAGIIATTARADDISISVAWLHDCVEDQSVTFEEIRDRFGHTVEYGVACLSDLDPGNRATRQRLSRERLEHTEGWIQNIKVADIISNCSSIKLHDPKFARVYLEEKRMMLDVLTRADSRLTDIAWKIIND